MKRFLILSAATLLIFSVAVAARGEERTPAVTFKNITIDTAGDQDYDLNDDTITSAAHTRVTVDDTVIETDSLSYSAGQNRITAAGNVRVSRSFMTLTADRLSLDLKTGWMEASGTVRYLSATENYQAETIRYNVKQMTGVMGPLRGVVQGWPRDFYLTGEEARMSEGVTVILNAELTRCPLKDYPEYSFASRRLVVNGNNIHMEQVFFKFFGKKAGYLPRLIIQGVSVPHIDLTANQCEEIDLNREEKTAVAEGKIDKVRVDPRFRIKVNPIDKPSVISAGRIYTLNRYSEEVDLNFDSRGIFSILNIFQIDWPEYNLTFDGRADLAARPQKELGLAFTKKAWETAFGNWQAGLVTRWLYYERTAATYQGVYGGYRLDYQLNPDLNLGYLYLDDLSGSNGDWERLEDDFLVINNYRLGGNFLYSLTVPLSLHYVIVCRGYYGLERNSWTSQKVLFSREVGSVKMGLGWDFAKDFIELQFRMSI